MDKAELYNQMAERKSKPKDFEPYAGDNGRVNKALVLYRTGKLKTNQNGTHLDIGGAIGDLGYALRKEKLFATTAVIDIARKALEAAGAKGNLSFLADIDAQGIPFHENDQIDSISALDFIEHIIDPGKFASECFRVLKPGGEVFINTPNIRYWKHIEQLSLNGTFPHTSGDTDVFHGGHLAFYTYRDLQMIFGAAGFEKFEMIKDEEGYENPPLRFVNAVGPRNQNEYAGLCLEFGCPNLLFKATKP